MIQRVQTLFLLQLIFLSLSLMFVPVHVITDALNPVPVKLLPLNEAEYHSTTGHYAAVALNFGGLVIAFAAIFLYKRRMLQVKLCYVLVFIYAVITGMIALCPFVDSIKENMVIHTNVFGYIICAVCIVSALLAVRFIKKDINLLKSTERIR
jgi:hypothetical protein